EHMAFKGTKKLTYTDINGLIENIGGSMNAFTSHDKTVYYATVLSEHLEKALEFVRQVVFESTYPEEELEKERKVVVQEIKMYRDDPSSVAYYAARKALIKNNPMGSDIIGTEEQVLSYNRDNLLEFVKTFYTPDNLILSVSGPVSHRKI